MERVWASTGTAFICAMNSISSIAERRRAGSSRATIRRPSRTSSGMALSRVATE